MDQEGCGWALRLESVIPQKDPAIGHAETRSCAGGKLERTIDVISHEDLARIRAAMHAREV